MPHMSRVVFTGAMLFAVAGVGVIAYASKMFAPVAPTTTSVSATTSVAKAPVIQTTTHTSSDITRTRVAQHDTAGDCWLIVEGKVYDMTRFESVHPGGSQAIVDECGKDASAVFARVRAHARPGVDQELSSFYIGNVTK